VGTRVSCHWGLIFVGIVNLEPRRLLNRTPTGAVVVFERLAQILVSDRAAALALGIAIALALLAPLGPLASNRFHRDEAIYSSWGLDIASGRDLLLSGSPLDKPPLFFYVQALSFILFGPTEVAARIPSLVASVISVGLMYKLGWALYGRGVGLLAAFLLAASPFAILFAPTAFTDPLMVTWVLAGCLVAVRGHWVWGGVFLGLAAITKQQGTFFVPLALGLGLVSNVKYQMANGKWQMANGKWQVADIKYQISNGKYQILRFGVAFLAVLGLALAWDMARARQPGFLVQSLISYGGLSPSLVIAWEHLRGYVSLLRYAMGSPVLNLVLLVGLPLLLVTDGLAWRGASKTAPSSEDRAELQNQAWFDLILVVFVAFFLVVHSLAAFVVWDRYLLGLIPLSALLLARVLALPWRLLRNSPSASFIGLLFVLFMLSFTFRPICDAAASRFPVGGDHGAYQGVEQVANYFQAVPADTTLYHRWLGWHWRFYLWGSPFDFPAWTSPADLAAQAAARPGAQRYIVFPSWRSATEVRLALADAGLAMHEVQRVFRDDGSISFIIYRIEESP
jgi:hypothetical protein